MDEVDLSLVKREIETERDANNPPPKRQRVESLAQQLGSELRGIISEVLNGQLYQVIKRSGHYPIDPETSSQFGIRNVKRACDKVHHSFLHDWISNIDRKLHTALLSTEGAVKDEALMEMSLECLDGLIDKVRPQFAGIHERCLHIVQYCVKCMTSSDQSLFPRFSKAFCEALRQRFDQWTDEMVEELGKEVRAEMGNPFLDDGITFADLEVPKPTGVITSSISRPPDNT